MVKTESNHTISLLFRPVQHCVGADAHTDVLAFDELVQASAIARRRSRPGDPRRPSAVLIIASTLEPSRPIPFLSFFLSARRDRAELAAARPPGSSSPPRSNPSRPELRNLSPTLLHLSSTPAVPKPGRNRAPAVAAIAVFPGLRPLRRALTSGPLRPKSSPW